MNTQNILKYYGRKMGVNIDSSELFDYILDTTDVVDLVLDNSNLIDFCLDNSNHLDLKLDYSEFVDFQLDFIDDNYLTPISISKSLINIKISTINYAIQNEEGIALLTQDGEIIQFQY